MAKRKSGKITIPPGVLPSEHELNTVAIFCSMGKDVEFLAPRRIKGSKTPDMQMEGKQWELKSPTGGSKTTIGNTLKRAIRQSTYIIIDTRHTKMADRLIEAEIRRNFKLVRRLKTVLLVVKDGSVVEISR